MPTAHGVQRVWMFITVHAPAELQCLGEDHFRFCIAAHHEVDITQQIHQDERRGVLIASKAGACLHGEAPEMLCF